MQVEEMYDLLHRRPFEPFRLHLSDGRVFDVRYPEMNMVGVTWVRIGVLAPDETDPDPFPDHSVKVPLSYIVRVEPLPAASSMPQP